MGNIPPLRGAFWLLVFLGTLPALIYLGMLIQSGIRGEDLVQPVYFRGYYGLGFILVFVCIAWVAQQLNLWWGMFLGLPALFVGIYPALENFGSEKLVNGAVVAFDLDKCPLGWVQYTAANGRVIVGAGKGTIDEQNRELSLRTRGETGGEEKHKLTIAEMPIHNHNPDNSFTGLLMTNGDFTVGHPDQTPGEPYLHAAKAIVAQGGDQEHNTMPPFRVLTFCVKQAPD